MVVKLKVSVARRRARTYSSAVLESKPLVELQKSQRQIKMDKD